MRDAGEGVSRRRVLGAAGGAALLAAAGCGAVWGQPGGRGDASGWRAMVAGTAQRVAAGRGTEVGGKFRELPYFLQEARERGFPLPLTERLYAVCDEGERVTVDDNRPAPSFYRQLARQIEPDAPT